MRFGELAIRREKEIAVWYEPLEAQADEALCCTLLDTKCILQEAQLFCTVWVNVVLEKRCCKVVKRC